jgi:hypothetical protein
MLRSAAETKGQLQEGKARVELKLDGPLAVDNGLIR